MSWMIRMVSPTQVARLAAWLTDKKSPVHHQHHFVDADLHAGRVGLGDHSFKRSRFLGLTRGEIKSREKMLWKQIRRSLLRTITLLRKTVIPGSQILVPPLINQLLPAPRREGVCADDKSTAQICLFRSYLNHGPYFYILLHKKMQSHQRANLSESAQGFTSVS